MASIIQKRNRSIEIRFKDKDGRLQSLYPGKISKRDAESIGRKIDHIIGRQICGADPDRDVAQWLADLPDKLYAKFVKKGLAAPRQVDEAELEQVPTIREWCDAYIKDHPGSPRTIELLTVTARSLCHKFGDHKRIDEFTAGDAEAYRKWLQTNGNERKGYAAGLAQNTVRRTIGRCKQFFGSAIKHELITRNPFEGEASAVTGNSDRLFLVPADWIEACISKAPCEDWRIMLAFARYAGMRSHETRIQRWDDIDLVNNVMVVRSNKTPPIRRCPIFPELRPHLLRAREYAPSGAELVVTRYDANANVLTTLEKIVVRAGLVPWPKLMQNLRATRETELLAHYPAKDVTSWLGNSPDVANKHYAMTMQASFDRAVVEGAKIIGVTTTPPTPQKTPPKTPPTMQAKGGNTETQKKPMEENPVNNWVCLASAFSVLATKLPETTLNATFCVATKVVVFHRKHGAMAALQFVARSECGAKSRPRRPSPQNVVQVAQEYHRCLSQPDVIGYRQVARQFGVTKARVSQYLSVLRLPPGFVYWLEKCRDPTILHYFTERRLRSIARLPRSEQVQSLCEAASHLDVADGARAELLNVLRDCAT